DHHVNVVVVLGSTVQAKRHAVGVVGQVGACTRAVPGNILAPEAAAGQARVRLAKRNHVLEETKNVAVRLQLAPVKPSSDVVLVIGIIVAILRVQKFVAGAKHGGAVDEFLNTQYGKDRKSTRLNSSH